MSKEEIEIRRLELDIIENKLYMDETEAQIRFEEKRADINRERNDLELQMMELQITDLKGKL